MPGRTIVHGIAIAALIAGLGVPAAAQDGAAVPPTAELTRFKPRTDAPSSQRFDFEPWDESLGYFVLRMGSSLRESASRPEPLMGSHIVYGHDSALRLEGNRYAFNYIDDETRTFLSEYRRDLESLPDRVDLARMPRNEQLAYWINLHNVAVTEQIALAYPIPSPEDVKIGGVPLDEARFITVSGVALSPKDIRTRIVYPNWSDPKVIYGFWRGAIGGPSLMRDAFTGSNLAVMLDDSAREFVASLRGTQKRGDTLHVSRIYDEARPFYFADWPGAMRSHLREYGNDDVAELLDATSAVEPKIWERDLADLSKGEREPNYNTIVSNGNVKGISINGAVARMLVERREKMEKLRRDSKLLGRVIVLPDGSMPAAPGEEVE